MDTIRAGVCVLSSPREFVFVVRGPHRCDREPAYWRVALVDSSERRWRLLAVESRTTALAKVVPIVAYFLLVPHANGWQENVRPSPTGGDVSLVKPPNFLQNCAIDAHRDVDHIRPRPNHCKWKGCPHSTLRL